MRAPEAGVSRRHEHRRRQRKERRAQLRARAGGPASRRTLLLGRRPQRPLDERIERLKTIRFHKKLGSYFEKAQRVEQLARWIADEPLASPQAADGASMAGRLAKADLATEMVAELTEFQGVMGGIYAREEGQPERVWKAIYYHYLPDSIAPDAPPTRQQLGEAAVTWAAVSLADKLDTVVGMFYAGEKPTGSRDPFGLRRQAHGIFKILVDLPELTGLSGHGRC